MASTVLDLASRPDLMVSADPPMVGGTPSTIGNGNVSVSYSGESILFAPQDSTGAALPLVALRNSDDVQILALTGVPASSSLTLKLNDQTSAPIPLAYLPPLTSFVWAATLPQAGSFDLALAWGYYGTPPGGAACSAALIQVFDSGTLIGSFPLDQTRYPDPSVDIAVTNVGIFKAFGTFNFATTNLEVHLSGAANSGTLLAGMLRLVPHGSTDVTTIGYVDPSNNRAGGSDGSVEGHAGIAAYGAWTQTFYYTNVGSWHGVWYAAATGTQATAFPKLADVQAALQGLANVPAGGVAVAAVSNQQFSIHFTGALGGQPVTSLVSSDPAFSVIHDDTAGSSVGGQYPSVTVNGTNHILRAASYAVGQTAIAYHLIQDAPDIQYEGFGTGLFQSGYYNVLYNTGFGGQVGYPTSAGPTGLWRFQGLPAAQYQVAITWPTGDPNGDVMQAVIRDGLGNTLATVGGIDQSQAPNDFQEGGVGWKVLGTFTLPAVVNGLTVSAVGPGTSNKHLILDTARLARVSPRQGIKILPTDNVQFNAPAGFITTSGGPLAALSGMVVSPAAPTRLTPLSSRPKAMKLGMNIDPPNYFGTDPYFANMAVQANVPMGLARSAAGNPTQLGFDPRYGFGSAITLLTQPPADALGAGRGVPNCPSGVWVVQWQGSSWNFCQLISNDSTTSVVEDTARRVVGTVNRRYFQVQDPYFHSPGLTFGCFSTMANADGTYACDISNVAIFPPDVDPAQTSRWRPSFLAKLKGLNCVRFMDLFGTNNLNLSKFAHFPDPANFPLGYGGRSLSIPIASIGPPVADAFAENVAGTVVQVKTKVPHGLATGFNVKLRTTDGTSLGQVIGNTIDSKGATTTTARDPIDPTDGYNGAVHQNLCHVIDATTIQIGINVASGPLGRMVNTLTPANGIVYADLAPGAMMAPSDAADLCAAVGVEPWVNVPWLADDDCVTQLAQAFVARVPKGTQVHVEYGNEAWNYAFTAFFYCVWANNLNGNPGVNYVPVYLTRMSQVHAIFQNVWAAAGRNVAEIRRVCGTQYDNSGGTTVPIVQYALANGITFDELAPATYYSNGPACGANDDLLTREQLLDLFALNLQQSSLPALLAGHMQAFSTALAQNPTQTWLGNVVLVNYEGGPDTMTTSTMSANVASRNHAVHRDPDFCQVELQHLQMLQDAGVTLFNIFTLYGTRDLSQWGVYEGAQMQAGTGDATIDVANRNDFENLTAITSETAGALRKWAALLPQPTTTAARPRNGELTTVGGETY